MYPDWLPARDVRVWVLPQGLDAVQKKSLGKRASCRSRVGVHNARAGALADSGCSTSAPFAAARRLSRNGCARDCGILSSDTCRAHVVSRDVTQVRAVPAYVGNQGCTPHVAAQRRTCAAP